jgi:hypothetical protein
VSRPHETPQDAAQRLAAPAIRKGFRVEGLHIYTDPNGTPLHWKIRAKHPATRDKWIRLMMMNGRGFELKEPAYPNGKPLYRLHELTTAPGLPVMLTEGEPCADVLTMLGLLATTSGAANSAGRADWRPLAGRTVTIWRDNDNPGLGYQCEAGRKLLEIGCTVRIIDVAALGLGEKADAVDWLAAHPYAQAADVAALPSVEFTGGWPARKPITADLKPVPDFDPETLLPDVLRAWIMDEAERMPCPADFVATAALVALGALIGARCAITPKAYDSWLIVPNVWGGIVGDPADKKSPAWGAALTPLDRLVAKALATHTIALADYESAHVEFEARKDAIERRIKKAASLPKGDVKGIVKELQTHGEQAPVQPTLRRYKTNDTTIEKLGELLRENPQGLLVLRDELVGLIASWDRPGRDGDRPFFLEAWNGNQGFDTDRIGRGHIAIPNVCVSIFGGIQPDKLTDYLEQAAHALANDGLLPRFQVLVFPDRCPWQWRDRGPNKAARDAAFAVFQALADFDPVSWGASPADDFHKFPHFRFDPDAQTVFIQWSADLHGQRIEREDDPMIRQHLAKYDKLCPALALIVHLVDCAATGRCGPVMRDAVLRAAAWCEYLEAHARRCYGLLKDDGLRAAQALAGKLEHGALADGFTPRDVRRHQWRSLITDEAVQAALDWLEDEGWLRREVTGGTGPGSGRPTYRYRMHPSLPCKQASA